MKYLRFFILHLYALSFVGCGGDNPSTESKTKGEKVIEWGYQLPNGSFANLRTTATQQTFSAHMEISDGSNCYIGEAKIPMSLINGEDRDGQYWVSKNFNIQIHPNRNGHLPHNQKFVHFIIDRNEVRTAPCSPMSKTSVRELELSHQMQRTYFSDLPITESQLLMAKPELSRGSSKFMLFLRSYNIGFIFDSNLEKLIGLSVPKISLQTEFLFTVNRQLLDINEIPEDALFPLLMSDDDIRILNRSRKIASLVREAAESVKDESSQVRDFVLSGVWAQVIKNEENR